MFQDIFIIGATGNVGSELVNQIYTKGDTLESKHVHPTRVVGLASRSSFIYNPKGISGYDAQQFSKRILTEETYTNLEEFLSIVQGKTIFVDMTAEKEPMLQFHLNARKDNHSVVTANKNPLVDCDYETFINLTSDPHSYGYRCSVMAGSPAIPKLLELRDVNDKPLSISGCLSGTLGYICSELQKGERLSQIVTRAKELGYTEPHPRDDLGGFDIARKLCILARSSGYRLSMKDIDVEPFIPQKYLLEDNVKVFLSSLTHLDADFDRRVKEAANERNVLRYPGEFNVDPDGINFTARIGLRAVPQDSPMGALRGTLNKIVIRTAIEDHSAIEGAGAGREITARNTRKDIAGLLYDRKICE